MIEDQGYEAGRQGKGLSDCPVGGCDGLTWRMGMSKYLAEEEQRKKDENEQ